MGNQVYINEEGYLMIGTPRDPDWNNGIPRVYKKYKVEDGKFVEVKE